MSSNAVSDGSSARISFGLPSIIVPDAEVPSIFEIVESDIVNSKLMRSSISNKMDVSKHQDDKVPSLSRVTTTSVGPRIFSPFPRKPAPDPKVYLDDAWRMLKPAIGIVFNDEPEHFSCAEICNAVDKAWRAKSGEALFKLILEECGIHISAALRSLEGHCKDDPSVFSPLVEKCWLDFQRRMWYFSNFAGGEWRVGGRTLWELGLHLFRAHLCLAPNANVLEKVFSTILLFITDQRLGKPVDMSQLKKLMDVFNAASLYDSPYFFEKRFVQCAAEFYAAEAHQVLERFDFPHYLKYVEQRLGEEKEKCIRLYFFCKFRKPLIEVVERELLGVHASSVLEKGFAKLMDESCQVDLQRLYNLFSEADLLNHLNEALSSYILETGRKIRAQGLSLAEFKVSVDKICHSYFLEDELLEKTIEHCFMDLVFSAL